MVNKVTLIGNLGADPEIKYLQSGMAVANLRLATSYKRKNQQTGNLEEFTEWHRLVCYDKTAEFCQYLSKGYKIYILGRLQSRKYTDSNNIERYVTEIIVNELKNLTSRSEGEQINQRQQANPNMTQNMGGQQNTQNPNMGGQQNTQANPIGDEVPF
jgi:single-strand DNA-binding protein